MTRNLSAKSTLRHGDKNYKIIAVNFRGKSMEPVRREYIKNGEGGLRRRVIVIDLDEERQRLAEIKSSKMSQSVSSRQSLTKRKAKETLEYTDSSDGQMGGNSEVSATLAILAIQRLIRQYEETTAILAKEMEFNLFAYWNELLQKSNTGSKGRRKNSIAGSKSLDLSVKKKRLTAIKEGEEMAGFSCFPLQPQLHNKVGRPTSLLNKKYIEDEPPDTKLFIILVGNFDNDFYLDLIQRGEPLQAIVDFLPGDCSYELLIPNPAHKNFLAKALQEFQQNMYEFRQEVVTKPVGIFRQSLPKISSCLAEKYSLTIYDQLTWAFYDIELLFQNYNLYYLAPFKETNVSIPNSVSLGKVYSIAKNTTIHGNYLQTPFPVVDADNASIILFMNMLFSTIDQSDEILTEWETILLSTPLPKRVYSMYSESVNILAKKYADAFYSITKMKKVERLFIEENNTTLLDLVQYVDHERFRSIYLACLEYKIQRKYINNDYHRQSVNYLKYGENDDFEDIELPPFAKLYATEDGVIQRLLALLDDHDDYVVLEIRRNLKLYRFNRNLNEVIEHNRMFVIPTRLCFRDFTLFRLEEFLADLVTEAMHEYRATAVMSDMERFERVMRRYAENYNPDIFIRPKSLKARRMDSVSALLGIKTSKRGDNESHDVVRQRELQMAADALTNLDDSDSYVGLPPGHPLLSGYNLEDIRQEIWIKTSKYFFEEGSILLYEDKWCFTDINKNLKFEINQNELTLGTKRRRATEILPKLRLTTKNKISIRLEPQPDECAKIVLNYPNGLSIYYQEKHAEQVWTRQDTPNEEKRRIITPYGAVIVHYQIEHMILIMRYNGEIYKLYQYEFPISEVEDEDTFTTSGHSSSERTTLNTTKSKMFLQMLRNETDKIKTTERLKLPKEAVPLRQDKSSRKSHSKRSSKQRSSNDPGSYSIGSSISLGSFDSDKKSERELIPNELDFLTELSHHYNLSFKHLIVTTSIGRVFNLTNYGRFYESQQLSSEEWHDYYVDESYTAREDSVYMVWSMDKFKCFHADGTVLVTSIDNIYHKFELFDEYATVISESSSHKNAEEETIGDGVRTTPTISEKIETISIKRISPKKKKRPKTYEQYLSRLGEGEEEGEHRIKIDDGYMCVKIANQEVHHLNYASVYFLPQFADYDKMDYIMEIKGSDDIVVQKAVERVPREVSSLSLSVSQVEGLETEEESTPAASSTTNTEESSGSPQTQSSQESQESTSSKLSEKIEPTESIIVIPKMHVTSPQTMSTSSSPSVTHFSKQTEEQTIEEAESEQPLREVLKLWIGPGYYIIVSEEEIEIQATISRRNSKKEIIRDTVKFKISYTDNIQEVFRTLVARISSFKRYNTQKTQEIFFLEKLTQNCEAKGIEFMEELPDLGKYQHEAGNTITQFKKIETIFKKFSKKLDFYKTDLAKFPRFRVRPEKRRIPLDLFPMVLSVNLFLKVPELLRNSSDIHKFMDPLDNVNFKKTRYQIKETMNCYVHPYFLFEIKKLSSKTNWEKHHEENKRRVLIEAQRMGLYHAILRHKTYPKYFEFHDKYGGRVECINYFDYCLDKCMEKTVAQPKLLDKRTSKTTKQNVKYEITSPETEESPRTTLPTSSIRTDISSPISTGKKFTSHSV